MLRLQQYLPTPNGVQPNGTGSLNLPLGAHYYQLKLDITDGATVMNQAELSKRIKNLRLKLNGTQVRQYNTIDELININAMHGLPTSFGSDSNPAASVVFYFAEPQRRTPAGEDIFAWLCYEKLGITSFTLEFEITSSASADINVQVSRTYAQAAVSSLPASFGNIIWHSSQTLPNDTAGKPSVSTLQKTAYTRIHACAAPDTFDGAQVKVNNLVVRDFRKQSEYDKFMHENGLPTVENWLTIPFDETNRYDEILDVRKASSFVVEYNTKKAGAITLILEELKGL